MRITFTPVGGGPAISRPCQIIGISGFLQYAFVWTKDDGGQFVILEYTTGMQVIAAQTLDQAQRDAERRLKSSLQKFHKVYLLHTQLNSMADYGFSRKPE